MQDLPRVKSGGETCFKVLYLFAGVARQADFGKALSEVVQVWNSDANGLQISLEIEEIDTLRGGLSHNLLEPTAQDGFIQRILEGEFDLVLIAPPMQHVLTSDFPG